MDTLTAEQYDKLIAEVTAEALATLEKVRQLQVHNQKTEQVSEELDDAALCLNNAHFYLGQINSDFGS